MRGCERRIFALSSVSLRHDDAIRFEYINERSIFQEHRVYRCRGVCETQPWGGWGKKKEGKGKGREGRRREEKRKEEERRGEKRRKEERFERKLCRVCASSRNTPQPLYMHSLECERQPWPSECIWGKTDIALSLILPYSPFTVATLVRSFLSTLHSPPSTLRRPPCTLHLLLTTRHSRLSYFPWTTMTVVGNLRYVRRVKFILLFSKSPLSDVSNESS